MGDNRRLGTATLILGLGLIAATAWLGAASLRLRSGLDFLLAAYLIGSGGVIVLLLALSPFELVTRGGVLAGSALMVAAAAALWQWRGRPAAPSARAAASAVRELLRDPVLAILAVAVFIALAYAAALAVATPPNDFDVLWYHLPRAAIWAQEHAVHYIDDANNVRLNVNPPGAEILSTWSMTLEGSDRFAGVFQVAALPATMLAVARISGLIGLERRAAAFCALLFASLPVVALQSATAGNDVVVTSYLVACVAFMLSDGRRALALGGFALALSCATKGTVMFAIPLLIVVALVLVPPRRWLAVASVGAVSIAVGAFWYLLNRIEAGGLTPAYEEGGTIRRASSPLAIPSYMARLVIDAVDPVGSVGRDRYAYAVAALVVLVVAGLLAYRARSRSAALVGAAAAALVLVPVSFASVQSTLLRGYQSFLVDRGEQRLAFLGLGRESTLPTPFTSWYGPIGLLAFLIAVALVVHEIRRGTMRRGSLVLVLAPLLTLPVVALTWTYSPFHGRFFMPAVALSAATWGLMLRTRALAWGMSVAAVVTLVLAFVHYREKPIGFSLLEGRTERSVWTSPRVDVMSSWAVTPGPEVLALQRLESLVRDGDTIALRMRETDVSYPYFGAELDRRVVFVGDAGRIDGEADWLVVAPGLRANACAAGWSPVAAPGTDWRLYRRVGLCPGETAER